MKNSRARRCQSPDGPLQSHSANDRPQTCLKTIQTGRFRNRPFKPFRCLSVHCVANDGIALDKFGCVLAHDGAVWAHCGAVSSRGNHRNDHGIPRFWLLKKVYEIKIYLKEIIGENRCNLWTSFTGCVE